MGNPLHRKPRPKGTGNISRVRLDCGRIRYRAVAPQIGQRRGRHLGTFDTEEEAEETIEAWMRLQGDEAHG